ARKQEYLPPYDYVNHAPEFLSPEEQKKYREGRIAVLKDKGVYVVSYTPEQDEQYRAMGLKVMPKQEGRYFSSTIDFYTPTSYRDPKINRSYAAGTVMQIYGYEVPPGLRVWTDDYSNVLSVFRW